MSSTTLAAPLLLALQREILEREAWPLLRRRRCPGRTRASGAPRATRSSTAFPSAELAEAARDRRVAAHPGHRATRTRSPASTRRGWPARPAPGAAARGCARRSRWAITLWPTPAAAQQAGMGTREFEDFVDARAVPRPRRPGRRVGRAARVPGGADRAARAGARDPHRGRRAPTCTLNVDGPHVDQLRRQAQHAVGRGLHRAARDVGRGRDPLHDPDLTARRGRRGRDARVPRGPRGQRAAPSAATPTCRRRSRPTPAPAILGELGIGTNFGIDRPIGAILFDEKIGGTVHLALGRSYPGDRRHQRVRRALGHDLRPAPGRDAVAPTARSSSIRTGSRSRSRPGIGCQTVAQQPARWYR